MSTYTTPAPNLVATLWNPLQQIVTPLLDHAPDLADPGVPELLAALGDALTAAVRITRGTPATPAPIPARPAAVRAPAARLTTAQVGSVAGEPKPGSLRAKLITYLNEHPGQAFTATELFHALDATSGGAVGAALNTMTAHGEAVLVDQSPKRYAAPTTATIPAEPPAAPSPRDEQDTGEHGADPADEPDTDAAGQAEAPAESGESPDLDAADESRPDDTPAAPKARAARGRKPTESH